MITFILFLVGVVIGNFIHFWYKKANSARPRKIEDTQLEHEVMRWFIEEGVKGNTECLDRLLEIIRPHIP